MLFGYQRFGTQEQCTEVRFGMDVGALWTQADSLVNLVTLCTFVNPLSDPEVKTARFLDIHMPSFNKYCQIVPTCLCQLHFHYLCRRVLITLDTQHLISSDWNVCQLSKEEMLFHGFHFAFFKLLMSFYCK